MVLLMVLCVVLSMSLLTMPLLLLVTRALLLCLVMLSTTLTVVDGFPRAIAALFSRLAYDEPVGGDTDARGRAIYLGALLLLACGSIAVIVRHLGHLGGLVDLATTLSFLTALSHLFRAFLFSLSQIVRRNVDNCFSGKKSF